MDESKKQFKLPARYLWLHVLGTAIATVGAYGIAEKYIEFIASTDTTWLTLNVSVILILLGIILVIPSIIYLQTNKKHETNKD